MKPDSPVHRVYDVFNSLDEFKPKAMQAVAGLRRFLNQQDKPLLPAQPQPTPSLERDPIPLHQHSTPNRPTSAPTSS